MFVLQLGRIEAGRLAKVTATSIGGWEAMNPMLPGVLLSGALLGSLVIGSFAHAAEVSCAAYGEDARGRPLERSAGLALETQQVTTKNQQGFRSPLPLAAETPRLCGRELRPGTGEVPGQG